MAMSNHQRVGRALELLRDGIREPLERLWKQAYGDDWVQEINQKLSHPDRDPDPDDLAFLLKGIDATWNELFRKVFGRAERSYINLLREARNEWAHNKRFSSDETYRILDQVEIILKAFHAKDQVEEVQKLRKGLQRQVFQEEARSEQRKLATTPTQGEPLAGLSPWRDIVAPHPDVAQGRFEQAEFAADLWQVLHGRAEEEYQDPQAFFARTYITEGLRDLIKIAAKRLSGQGGDPVVELQTSFGGGKTHSLIALYHLASGVPTTELPGVDEILAEGDLDVPKKVNRAVFVGQMVSPSSVDVKPDGTEVRTMWGEIAWQLGGAEGYAIVADDDRNATNPGDKLIELFERFGPALILIDEWVAYARDLPMSADERRLPAGDFDTQFTFAQALTEAAKAVPNTLVVVSIPSSDLEVGGEKGRMALERLKNVVSRTAVQWRPASADESFEIVRRRLFEPIDPEAAKKRDAVVRAFHRFYLDNADEVPSEAREKDYERRMIAAYPIHPELFDRLYEDWSTLERFQRTRGVLRLMATVIAELWKRGDASLMVLPASIPMDSGAVVAELTKYLDDRWEPIIRSDVDGPNSLPLRLDQEKPHLGRYSAARRVARTIYLGSAPRPEGRKGIDTKHIILGSVQPGERIGTFHDALRHLASHATYLFNQGSVYWYDTKATLTRLATDRAESNYSDDDVDIEIRRRIQSVRDTADFGAVHVFPDGPGDVPDEDDAVRLVILSPNAPQRPNGNGESLAIRAATTILKERHGGPRLNRNLLVFLAADGARIVDLRRAVRLWLAWRSILDERGAEDLDLSPSEVKQAETQLREADEAVNQQLGETFQHVLSPRGFPARSDIEWHKIKATGAGSLAEKAARKLISSEELITRYSGIRVRMDLDRPEAPLWEGDHISIRRLWEHYCQRLYMPRLARFEVLAEAISDGVAQVDWQSTFAYAEGHDPERDVYIGLTVGRQIALHAPRADAYLVKPERAMVELNRMTKEADDEEPPGAVHAEDEGGRRGEVDPTVPRRFWGSKVLDPVRAIRDFGDIFHEVVEQLEKAPGAKVRIRVDVEAEAEAFDDAIRRTVEENARQLRFDDFGFESRT